MSNTHITDEEVLAYIQELSEDDCQKLIDESIGREKFEKIMRETSKLMAPLAGLFLGEAWKS